MKLIPIVLSGGSGTRLWPISRVNYPKQFSRLLDESLQVKTLKRLKNYGPSIIVTSAKHKVLTESELAVNRFPVQKIIFETEGKNTAPAIALACKYLELTGQADSVAGVFSSDALITNEGAFHKAVAAAIESANSGKIVTLGISPTRAETGFGYIQLQTKELGRAAPVLKFHEKPSIEKAEEFVASGNFFWNAGIFIFKVAEAIKMFKAHVPDLWNSVDQLNEEMTNISEVYSRLKAISFDYAIMEKLTTEQMSCVPCDIGWSDLGSWDVLEQLTKVDSKAVQYAKSPIQVSAKNNTVFSKENKVYSFAGTDDLIVVDTQDALLICKKGESQLVRTVAEQVKVTDPNRSEIHPYEIRPWGEFETIKDAEDYKSKLITILPGQKLSYQSHQFRSEHWIIVQGSAEVTLNDQLIKLEKGQHVSIPQGAKHRIANPGTTPLKFVEVQLGTSFAESDITRYQDDYGRL